MHNKAAPLRYLKCTMSSVLIHTYTIDNFRHRKEALKETFTAHANIRSTMFINSESCFGHIRLKNRLLPEYFLNNFIKNISLT